MFCLDLAEFSYFCHGGTQAANVLATIKRDQIEGRGEFGAKKKN